MGIYQHAILKVGSINLKSFTRSLAFSAGVELQDDTVMGDDTRTQAAGLNVWSIDAEFNQSFSTGGETPDAAFATNVGPGKSIAVVLWPMSTATTAQPSPTNPKYSGTAVVETYDAFSGKVGDQLIATVALRPGGTLTRAVAT